MSSTKNARNRSLRKPTIIGQALTSVPLNDPTGQKSTPPISARYSGRNSACNPDYPAPIASVAPSPPDHVSAPRAPPPPRPSRSAPAPSSTPVRERSVRWTGDRPDFGPDPKSDWGVRGTLRSFACSQYRYRTDATLVLSDGSSGRPSPAWPKC